MEILLELPISWGIIITVLFISTSCIIVVLLTRKLIVNKINKQHEKVGRLLFRITAGLIALLISLSYTNEKVHQSKIISSMEDEASIIINVSMRLSHFESIEAKSASKKIYNYVKLTINNDWENISSDPYFSRITQSLIEANNLVLKMPTTNESEAFEKKIILNDLDEIIKLTQIRIYSHHAFTPYLIYILFCGLIFMWIFFTVYKVDFVSLLFLTLYNVLIAILIYFVFVMSNPLIGPLKVDAHSLIVVKTMGLDKFQEE